MTLKCLLAIGLLLTTVWNGHAQGTAATRQLEAWNAEFVPEIIEVAPGVYTSVGYGGSTMTMIVGDGGVVMVDTGTARFAASRHFRPAGSSTRTATATIQSAPAGSWNTCSSPATLRRRNTFSRTTAIPNGPCAQSSPAILNGIDLFQSLAHQSPHLVPVVVSVAADDGHVRRASQIGAADYLLKPFSDERFETALQRALRLVRTL